MYYTKVRKECHMIDDSGNSFEFSCVGCIYAWELMTTIRRVNILQRQMIKIKQLNGLITALVLESGVVVVVDVNHF
jgi:hypothetical protein